MMRLTPSDVCFRRERSLDVENLYSHYYNYGRSDSIYSHTK